MKILLDTCAALWLALDAPEVSDRARGLYRDADNDVYLSVVSSWEICLKYALGRLPLPQEPDVFVPAIRAGGRMLSLQLEEAATLQLFRLPPLHRDPFDRMLICQAIVGGMTLLTPDPGIRQYPVPTAW